MPTDAALTSPGKATSERASLEAGLVGQVLRALRVFLVDVEKVAGGSLAPDAEEFTLGQVYERWNDFIEYLIVAAETAAANPHLTAGAWAPRNTRPIVSRLTEQGGVDTLTRAKYLTAMRERLRASPLPQAAYDSAREILVRGRADNWSQNHIQRRLMETLNKDAPTRPVTTEDLEGLLAPMSGTTPKVPTYEQMARRIARTEATTLYNYAALTRLADAGAISKMWVSHHDAKVRPTHLHTNGDVQYLGEPFTVGGYSLMVPGDPNAPHSETANCRCVIIDGNITGLPNITGPDEVDTTAPLTGEQVPEMEPAFEIIDNQLVQVLQPTGNLIPGHMPVPEVLQHYEWSAMNENVFDKAHYQLGSRLRAGMLHVPIEPARWNYREPTLAEAVFGDYNPNNSPYGRGFTGRVKATDAAIQRLATTDRAVVYRGFVEFGEPLSPGMIFKDRMFVSVTADPAWALKFAQLRNGEYVPDLISPARERGFFENGQPVLARIVLPAGTNIGLGDPGIKELILMRNSRFRVLSEEILDGVRVATMELLPRTP